MELQTGNSRCLQFLHHAAIWPQHVLSLVPPISGQVTGTCDQAYRGGEGGGVSAFLDPGSRSQAL